MQSLERRIAELERAAEATAAPPTVLHFIVHFIEPGAGVVGIRNMATGHELERLADESEAHFLARAKLMSNTGEAQHDEP